MLLQRVLGGADPPVQGGCRARPGMPGAGQVGPVPGLGLARAAPGLARRGGPAKDVSDQAGTSAAPAARPEARMARPVAVAGDTPAASCEAGEPPSARLLARRSREPWASGSVPAPLCAVRAGPGVVVAAGPAGVAAARPSSGQCGRRSGRPGDRERETCGLSVGAYETGASWGGTRVTFDRAHDCALGFHPGALQSTTRVLAAACRRAAGQGGGLRGSNHPHARVLSGHPRCPIRGISSARNPAR